MGVPTSKRIKSQGDFAKIRASGKQLYFKSFVCQYILPSQRSVTGRRLGIIASRRVGNAVKRNRGKRIFRELFRIHEAKLPSSIDIVIIVRSSYSNYIFEELESHYTKACEIIFPISKN